MGINAQVQTYLTANGNLCIDDTNREYNKIIENF